jgi:hypothetical protein
VFSTVVKVIATTATAVPILSLDHLGKSKAAEGLGDGAGIAHRITSGPRLL